MYTDEFKKLGKDVIFTIAQDISKHCKWVDI